MSLKNISIVLVEPQGALNVGSVCRVMMNFGIRDLRFVNPVADHVGLESRKMALKAGFLLDEAKVFGDLAGALEDVNLAIGTTVRHGKYRKDYLTPDRAAEFILERCGENRTALVFGREDSGLSTKELDLCQHFITVPTDHEYSSMNLSHSVAVCLYEIKKTVLRGDLKVRRKKLAKASELESMFEHMKRTLAGIGFLDPENPDHVLRTFRRILGRSELDRKEVSVMHGFLSKIEWVKNRNR